MPANELPPEYPRPELYLNQLIEAFSRINKQDDDGTRQWEAAVNSFDMLILRGIHDVMKREIEAGRGGSLSVSFKKAYNIIMHGLRNAHPARITVKDGTYALTDEGYKREAEVRGLTQMTKERKMKIGVPQSADRRVMQSRTKDAMEKLREWITILHREREVRNQRVAP